MANKKDRVLAARQKANEFRLREERARKRNRLLKQLGIVVGAAAIVAVIVFAFVANRGSGVVNVPTASASVTVADTPDVPLTVGDGAVRIGPADAAVTLSLYEDFSCPSCQRYEAAVGSTLEDLVAGGDVAVEYHPIQFVSNYGTRAGSTAVCVATGAPDRFLDVHNALFVQHDSSTDIWRYNKFRDMVSDMGITDQEVLDCVADGHYAGWIGQNTNNALEAGVSGTPTLLVNGENLGTLNASQLIEVVDGLRSTDG